MRRALAPLLALVLAACAQEGLRAPALPEVGQYTPGAVAPQPPPAHSGAIPPQELAMGADIPAQWWTLFRSPALDALVREALDASPTLAKAAARLRQSREDLDARTGATRYPKVDARLSANRVDANPESLRVPALQLPLPLDLYLASVSVSYTFDLFGGTRSELEALRAEVDYERYELEAARLMLAGNVVTTVIRAAALRQQVAATEDVIALQARALAIAERREELGGVARADLVAQRFELARARAALPDLRNGLEQARHRLAVYLGRAPAAADIPVLQLADLRLPERLPVSLPSELARQRPDIRAAEALLHEAAARVGVATANLYPQLTLSANAGSLATSGDLFKGGSGFYLLGAALAQPLFHGDELAARRRSSVAAYDQAVAAYEDVVLHGLQNVADALRALEADAARLDERTEAAAQAASGASIAAARLENGGVSELALLDARRQLRNAEQDAVQATADRLADSAALLQALGGGWWNAPGCDNGDMCRSRP